MGPDKDDEQQTITVRDHIESLGYKINQVAISAFSLSHLVCYLTASS